MITAAAVPRLRGWGFARSWFSPINAKQLILASMIHMLC